VCRMRGDASRILRGSNVENSSNSPLGASLNGSSSLATPSVSLEQTSSSATLQPPNVNGTGSPSVHGRTSSFSYSSILTSAQTNHGSTGDTAAGNGALTNHDKPFQYTREEMLNIWKNNALKIKSSGIPLEFEKHDIFTSEETLDPVLLTDMTPAEREVFSSCLHSLTEGIRWTH